MVNKNQSTDGKNKISKLCNGYCRFFDTHTQKNRRIEHLQNQESTYPDPAFSTMVNGTLLNIV
jgi:hypothetical protein